MAAGMCEQKTAALAGWHASWPVQWEFEGLAVECAHQVSAAKQPWDA